MKQHKWHKEIKAWADGEVIETFQNDKWVEWDSDCSPCWDNSNQYRIKQQPKYLYVYMGNNDGVWFSRKYCEGHYIGKIKLE